MFSQNFELSKRSQLQEVLNKKKIILCVAEKKEGIKLLFCSKHSEWTEELRFTFNPQKTSAFDLRLH